MITWYQTAPQETKKDTQPNTDLYLPGYARPETL